MQHMLHKIVINESSFILGHKREKKWTFNSLKFREGGCMTEI
uniref:Uncharacterized protein n=1 Tax=Rhizophora mucronata TaxID=61149 RepID=A0A2P2NGZ2_RHIMU